MQIAMGHGQDFGTILQAHETPSGERTAHLGDAARIHDRPPVDLPELPGVQLAGQFLDGLADE